MINWKTTLKHALILTGITIVIGAIYSVTLSLTSQRQSSLLWAMGIIVLIVLPLVYSYFNKQSIKAWAIIAIAFIVISSTISLVMMGTGKNAARAADDPATALSLIEVFSGNPMTVIDSPICMPYMIKSIQQDTVKVCPLQRFGFFVELILLAIISFMLIFSSMLLGAYLARDRQAASHRYV